MARTIFVAHPISGDVEGNLKKVVAICKNLHKHGQIPIFPSFTWRQYLDDSEASKELARQVNREYFLRCMVDEVWFYGDHMSEGMRQEALLAACEYGIKCYGMTPATNTALIEMRLRPEGSYPGPPIPVREAY